MLFAYRLGVLVFFFVLSDFSFGALAEPPLIDCDLLAANLADPQRKGAGVPFKQFDKRADERYPNTPRIDGPLAIKSCQRADERYPNTPRLLFQLGISHLKEGNTSLAFEYYQKAVKHHYPVAYLAMGYLYESGVGVEKSTAEAIKYYEKALEFNLPAAKTAMGGLYFIGEGVPRDHVEAIRLLTEAADDGDSRAQWFLGNYFLEGTGVTRDFVSALSWFRKAVAQGHTG